MSIQNEYSSYIDSIYQELENGERIFADNFTKTEMEYLLTFLNNLLEYFKDVINHPHFREFDDGTSKEVAEIEVREFYDKRIKTILSDINEIKNWFQQNEKLMPGSVEFKEAEKEQYDIGTKALKSLEKIKEKEAKTGFPILRKKDAFAILKKYENKDYRPTTAEKNNIIKHPNFKKYTSQYTESRRTHFHKVIKKISKEKILSLEEFYIMCECPKSKFFKDNFIESLKFACKNPRGWFYENEKLRKLTLTERNINDTPKKEAVFTI